MNGLSTLGDIVREPGAGSIEFAGAPALSVGEAFGYVRQLHDYVLSLGLPLQLQFKTPFPETGLYPEMKSPRLSALWEATRREVVARDGLEDAWHRISLMNAHAATQLHISWDALPITKECIPPQIIFLMNIINTVGPVLARTLCQKYRVNNYGHLGIWNGWARWERFSRFGVWHSSFEEFRQFLAGTPRLIKTSGGDKNSDSWEVDLVNGFVWGVPQHELCGLWHLARPRARFGTLEIRILPSWPIETLENVLVDLVAFVDHVLDCFTGNEHGSFDEFRWTEVWRKISNFKVARFGSLPFTLGSSDWNRCAFT